MHFIPTALEGAFLIELAPRSDDRGFFARSWCREEFAAHGLSTSIEQCNIGYSRQAGTLRGIHFQQAPHAEAKVVRCCRGAAYDVIVDLRPDSATYLQWASTELTEDNRRMVYIPEGFGHGYQTLTDHAEMFYQTSHSYMPAAGCGVRYNDPVLGIYWPLQVTNISPGDRSWPDISASEGCTPTNADGGTTS